MNVGDVPSAGDYKVGIANAMTKRPAVFAAPALPPADFSVATAMWLWPRPPQMGADRDVAKTVDALFTAITARDEKLLGDCEYRLLAFKQEGNLPAKAFDSLDTIISSARAGSWESAAPVALRLHQSAAAGKRT